MDRSAVPDCLDHAVGCVAKFIWDGLWLFQVAEMCSNGWKPVTLDRQRYSRLWWSSVFIVMVNDSQSWHKKRYGMVRYIFVDFGIPWCKKKDVHRHALKQLSKKKKKKVLPAMSRLPQQFTWRKNMIWIDCICNTYLTNGISPNPSTSWSSRLIIL